MKGIKICTPPGTSYEEAYFGLKEAAQAIESDFRTFPDA